MAPGSAVGFQLLPVDPYPYPCREGLPAPDPSNCYPQTEDGRPAACLCCPHSEPSCSPPEPGLPLPSHLSRARLIQVIMHAPPPEVMPVSWRTQRLPSKVRSHLPVDQLANIALPLLGSLSRVPLPNGHLLPDPSSLPSVEVMKAAYNALRGKARSLLKTDWEKWPLPRHIIPTLCQSPPTRLWDWGSSWRGASTK